MLQEFLSLLQEHREILNEENTEVLQELKDCGIKCIENIGKTQNGQDRVYISEWNRVLKKIKVEDFLQKVTVLMKPVIDSYKNRDFKI